MGKDDAELNEELAKSAGRKAISRSVSDKWDQTSPCPPEPTEKREFGEYVQWSYHNGRFVPAFNTKPKLTPGVYEIKNTSSVGLFFEKIPVKTEGLIRFPDTTSEKVVEEITTFWEKGDVFEQYGLAYKRGILLWGPPGSGKSCTLQIIMSDVISRGGIVVNFGNPFLFIEGMRILRSIQSDTPVVVMMEDIDSIIQNHSESEVLNILDGVNQVDRIVFLATTNYPGLLGGRIVNRPSRFDKRFKIGFPTPESRRIYFQSIIGEKDIAKIDLEKWVRDTEGFSIAHLKELFIAVVILGDKYFDAVQTLRNMSEVIDDREGDRLMGFRTEGNCGMMGS